MVQVSYYKNISDISSKEAIDVRSFLKAIKSGKYKRQIEDIRRASTKTKQTALKKALPNITASGTFEKRTDSALIKHSGLKQIDFDKDKNPMMDPAAAKSILVKDQYTYAAFISPTGTGVKLLVQIDPQDEKTVYPALEQYYKVQYSLQLDSTCSNVSRTMFVSFDPDLYENPKSAIFKSSIEKANDKPIRLQKPSKQVEVEKLVTNIELSGVDITDRYQDWLNIGFALSSEFGSHGESYFHRISSLSPKYNQADCTKQYQECNKNRKSGVGINSLFAIAKEFNVYANTTSKPGRTKQKAIPENVQNEIAFYSPIFKNDEENNQVLRDIKINYVKFIELIYSFGFRRYDIDKDFIYIKIDQNVIKEVTILQIQDFFMNYLDSLPEQLSNGVSKKILKEKIYNNPKNYFCDNRLSLLISKEEIIFNQDTKEEGFIYFKNGFVKCTPKGYKLHPYNELKGFIWQNQIINRNFSFLDVQALPLKEGSVYGQFLFNVSNQEQKRFESLCSLIGYLLHSYTDVKMKAVILTDSHIGEEANGRTGKTLFGQTLKHIKKLTQINGKDFDPLNRYKYQEASLDTQIIFLNDVRSQFRFEVLYNDITEGITVEKKNQNPFSLKTKMCITTNKTIAIEGSSSKDRSIEFEFANHYSEKYSPEDEFKHRFFSDWDANAWLLFDNLMMYCICVYLYNGVIEPQNKNLNERKLLDQTHAYFIEFMRERINRGEITANKEILKQELHREFLEEYPEFTEDKYRRRLETFTRWLKIYAKLSTEFDENVIERKSMDKRYFTFASKKMGV